MQFELDKSRKQVDERELELIEKDHLLQRQASEIQVKLQETEAALEAKSLAMEKDRLISALQKKLLDADEKAQCVTSEHQAMLDDMQLNYESMREVSRKKEASLRLEIQQQATHLDQVQVQLANATQEKLTALAEVELSRKRSVVEVSCVTSGMVCSCMPKPTCPASFL